MQYFKLNKSRLKRLLALALTVITIFAATPTPVFAANGWDEANHRRWITCTTCGGSGSRVVICSKCSGAGCYELKDTGPVMAYWSGCTSTSIACGQPGAHSSSHSADCKGCTSKSEPCSSGCRKYENVLVCTKTETISCSTGSYQYDTTLPTFSLAKTIDAYDSAYTGQEVTVTATATDNLSGVYQYQFDGGTWQTSNTIVVPNTAGEITVSVAVRDNAGNITTAKTIDVKTIQNQAPLNITPPTDPTYGSSFTLAAVGGTTGNPIVWSVESGNATINQSGEVTPTGVGEVIVKAVMPGNTLYYDATATVSFTIAPKPISTNGTILINDKIYDGNISASSTSTLTLIGIESGDDVSIGAITADFDTVDIGIDKLVTLSPLSLSGSHADRYILTQPTLTGYKADITVKELTVSDTAVNDKIYDGNTDASYVIQPKLDGVVGSDDVTLQGGIPRFESATKGKDKALAFAPFTITGTKAGNYTLTQPIPGTANITAKQVTVIDVDVNDKTYDGTTNATYKTTPKLSGVIGSDDVTIVIGTPSFDNKNVGEDKVVSYSPFSLSGSYADNYAIVQPDKTTANVAKKEITVSPLKIANKYYDGNTTGDYSETPTLVDTIIGDDITLKNGDIAFDDADVGTSKDVTVSEFSVSGTDAGNYTLTQPTLTGYKADISKKAIIITPNSHSKVFGEVDPKLTYTHSEFINPDDTVTGELTRESGENAGEYEYIVGTLMVGDNYRLELAENSAKFAVTKALGKAVITATKSTTAPIDVILSTAVSGEDGNVEFYILGEKIKTVKVTNGVATATYKPVSAGNYTASCKLVGSTNYTDTTSNNTSFTVSQGEITPPQPSAPTPPSTSSKEDLNPTPSIVVESAINPPAPIIPPSVAVQSDNSSTPSGYTPPATDPWWENNLIQEEITKQEIDEETPSLIVIDITEGMDLDGYAPLLEEQHIDKSIIGVYSAKLLLGGIEIEPNETVEVKIPITGKLAEYTEHDVYFITDTFTRVNVKSADASASASASATAEVIAFDTNSLGYFAVVGAPNIPTVPERPNEDSVNWIAIGLWCALAIVIAGLFWILFLLWRKKKDEEDEE